MDFKFLLHITNIGNHIHTAKHRSSLKSSAPYLELPVYVAITLRRRWIVRVYYYCSDLRLLSALKNP